MYSTSSGPNEIDLGNDSCCVFPTFGNTMSNKNITNNERNAGSSPNRTINSHDDPTDSLVKELQSLSFKEREAVYDDIHGVATDVVENEEMIQSSLSSMRESIGLIPKRQRKVIDRAIFLKPRLLDDDRFLLMFLRAKQFDVRKSADQICLYFEHKLELFGEANLVHPIALKDLTDREKASLYRGTTQILPDKDRSGRTLRLLTLSACNWWDWKSELRCMWYQNMTAILDDEDVQRKGTVNLYNCYGDFSGIGFHIMAKFILQAKHIWDQWPFRILASHFFTDNSILNSFLSNLYNAMSKEMKVRTRNHFGSRVEVSYTIRSFGIDMKDYLMLQPSDEVFRRRSGRYILQRKRTEERERIERENPPHEQLLIPYPGPCDVLLGRGHVCNSSSGNQHFRQYWVTRFAQRYQQVESRLDKTLLATELLQCLQEEEGGRFLQRTDLGWEVVDSMAAREKISQALRVEARRRREKSDADVTTSGSENNPLLLADKSSWGAVSFMGNQLPTPKRQRVNRFS